MAGLIVAEWIERSGGAERVLDALVEAFPDARVRALWNDDPGRLSPAPDESWLARTPLRRHKALALPLMPPTWRALRSAEPVDWILSSVHLFAHHARLRSSPDVPRLAYVHSPARYLWSPEVDARGSAPLVRAAARPLRRIDRVRAQELTAVAVNSAFVAGRVDRAWGRASTVIHPPVDVAALTATGDWSARLGDEESRLLDALPSEWILGASRFVPYKRLDLVIEAGERAGLPVVIAGSGPGERALRERAARAGVPVEIVIAPSDALLRALLQRTSALVFPAVEDFGLLPVEAQALSTPVVTGPVGGQTEGIVPGVSGVIAPSVSPADLAEAVAAAAGLPAFDGSVLARRFDREAFVHAIRGFVARGTGDDSNI